MDARVTKDDQEVQTSGGGSGRRYVLLLVLALIGVAVAGYFVRNGQQGSGPAAGFAMAPPNVTVSQPLQRRIASSTTFTGQFSAIDRVEVRAQVSGYLTEIHFKDGQQVKKGDLLFVIDPRPYEIALANARAQVGTAEAQLDLSKKQLERTTSLMRSDFASKETLDQRTQAQVSAGATLDQAKAAVRSAELNMEWTHIVAPVAGRISTHRVSIGNLVAGGQSGAAPTLLTTIVSLDPIYLDFDMGEGDYIAYQRFLHRAPDERSVDRVVSIALSDETGWQHKGRLDFVDNEMDRSSGTIHARATMPNADYFVAAGQFARLRVPTSAPADALLLPDDALTTDQSRTLVMTVAADGTVVPKTVEVGPLSGNLRIVTGGLAKTDKVIINGLMFARPGGKVTPQQGTIEDTTDKS